VDNNGSPPEPPCTLALELSNWQLVLRLLKLSWRYRWGCVRVLTLQVFVLMFALSSLGLTGLGFDSIRHHLYPETAAPRWPFGLTPPSHWPVLHTVMIIAGAILLLAAAHAMVRYVFHVQTAKLLAGQIMVDLRSMVYNKMQRLSFRFFDANESGSIINRVTRDVQATRMFIDSILMQGITMLLSLAVFTAYMLTIHVPLTLACLATTPLLWLLCLRFSAVVKPAYKHNRTLVDRLILVLSESIQGMRVIKGFSREEETRRRFVKANQEVRDQTFWIFNRVCIYGPTISFLSQLNTVVLLSYGGILVIRGELLLGSGLIVFSGLLQQFAGQISTLVQLTNRIQDCLTAARRVFEVLDTPIEIQSQPKPIALPPKTPCAIEFDKVSFGYRAGELILRKVSFQAAPGQCIAVLGATGSGKSSLLSLIPRFYDPLHGQIRINGTDVRQLDLDDLRRNVGIVFQENFLFSNTIAANIAFGCPNAGRDQIMAAAKVAAAHQFIMEMPRGYDTILGESGTGISGGQRQRIAIARAVLLEPAILLLDDPTAAIDAETEHDIMVAMENAMQGRTTFIVAHRLSTLKRADHIIVLQHGRIVQSGRHDQLLNQEGAYRWMVSLQLVDDESRRVLADQGVQVQTEDVNI